MVHAKIDCRAHRVSPIVKALPRRPVDQVHAGAQAGPVGRPDTGLHIGGRMRAVEVFQHMRHG